MRRWIWIAMASLAALLLLAAAWHAESRYDEQHLEQAVVHKRWSTAQRLALALMRREPGNIVPAWLLEYAALCLPDDHEVWRARDHVHSLPVARRESVVAWATEFTRKHPQSPLAWDLLANAAVLAKKSDLAMSAAQKAVRLAPKSPGSYCVRGWAYHLAGDGARCLADARKEVELAPHDAPVYANVGAVYLAQHDPDRAVKAFEKCVKLDHYCTMGHINLGIACTECGKLKPALQHLNMAIALGAVGSDVYCARANVYKHLGELSLALQDYDKAVSVAPRRAHPYLVRGVTYQAMGYCQYALADFRHVDTIDPSRAVVHYDLAFTYDALGRKKEADREWSVFTELSKDKALAHYRHGEALLDHQHYQEAVSEFTAAIAVKPKADLFAHRCSAYMKLGDYQKALKDVQRAVALKGAGEDYAVRAWIECQLHQPRQALADATTAVRLAPKDAVAESWAAYAFEKLGKWSQARAAARAYLKLARPDDPGVEQMHALLTRVQHKR